MKPWKTMKLAAVAVSMTALAGAAAAEVDFSGKRITMTVPTAAGGGADLYARFLGQEIVSRLPGSPLFAVENVPGAGAIAGSNQFQDRANRDGTSILTASASVMGNFAFGDSRVTYRLDEWIPVISSPQGSVVYAHANLGISGAEDIPRMRDMNVVMGANNPTGGDLRILLAMDLLGVEVRPVFGMNRADAFQSFQRGELNLDFAINNAFEMLAVPMIEANQAVALFSMGFADEDGNIVRDPATPDLPHFLEVYETLHGEPLSGPQRRMWDSLFGLNVMATRAILLPDGTPQEVVDAYEVAVRQFLADMETDADLREQAHRFMGDAPQAAGPAAVRNLRNAVVIDPEGLEWLRGWLLEKFDAEL